MGKSWVMKSLATKWRSFKSIVKAKHEQLRHCDRRVLLHQWPILISHWNTEREKVCSTCWPKGFFFFGGLNAWPKTDIHILRHELNIQLIFNSTFQMKFGNVIIYRSSFVGVNCYKLGLLCKDEGCAYFRA